MLQLWSEAHSYFTTLSLNTLTLSSLCSRRPGGTRLTSNIICQAAYIFQMQSSPSQTAYFIACSIFY